MARRCPPLFLAAALVAGAAACGDDDGLTALDARIVRRDASAPACAPPRSVPDQMPCECASDCMEGAACWSEEEFGIPMGRCFRLCTAGAADGCGPAETCLVEFAVGEAVACWAACTSDHDCPTPSLCANGICFAHCSSDDDCRSGHCDLHTHLCTDGSPRTGAPNVAPCIRDSECRSGTCSASAMRCVTNCSTLRQDCPEGEICLELEGGGTAGACFPGCDTNADCAHLDVACALATAPDGSTVRVCG